jgi:hypothetical protein
MSLLAQASPGPPATPEEWTGCVQAGSTPSAFRLNLEPKAEAGPQAQQGGPYLQLLPSKEGREIQPHVGKRVRVRGHRLTPEEAQKVAAVRPDRQEANEVAAGTGGPPQRHATYVRVASVEPLSGQCR